MSEPIKKPNQSPKSYSPVKPEILGMAEMPDDNIVNGEVVPYLFKKQIIHLSKSKLVGKKVTYPISKQGIGGNDANPPLNLLWQECRKDGTFDWIEKQKEHICLEAHLGLYYDINQKEDRFSYLVGTLMNTDVPVPEGFASHEIIECDVAVCWFKYKTDVDIWAAIDPNKITASYMDEQKYAGVPETGWCSELYPLDDEKEAELGYNILGYLIACRKMDEV